MSRRLPGKKIREEYFNVDGVGINVELRLTDAGKFYCAPDANATFEEATLVELRTKVKAYLEETRRLHFDPFIRVDYIDAKKNSRYDNVRGRECHEEVELDFSAGWLSREHVGGTNRRWITVYVDEDTNEISPLTTRDREATYGDMSSRDLIPFTPDRWRRLVAIAEALADLRKKISEVLSDATGARLEAMTLPRLLEAAPA